MVDRDIESPSVATCELPKYWEQYLNHLQKEHTVLTVKPPLNPQEYILENKYISFTLKSCKYFSVLEVVIFMFSHHILLLFSFNTSFPHPHMHQDARKVF